MEFVDGSPLLDFAAKQALDVDARIDIFVQVCDALHYAHQQGVVHRDLKPDNLFVVEPSSSGSTASVSNHGKPKILARPIHELLVAGGENRLMVPVRGEFRRFRASWALRQRESAAI